MHLRPISTWDDPQHPVESLPSYAGVVGSQRARFRPELALTRLQLAEVLMAKVERGEAGSSDLTPEALQQLDFAVEERSTTVSCGCGRAASSSSYFEALELKTRPPPMNSTAAPAVTYA